MHRLTAVYCYLLFAVKVLLFSLYHIIHIIHTAHSKPFCEHVNINIYIYKIFSAAAHIVDLRTRSISLYSCTAIVHTSYILELRSTILVYTGQQHTGTIIPTPRSAIPPLRGCQRRHYYRLCGTYIHAHTSVFGRLSCAWYGNT